MAKITCRNLSIQDIYKGIYVKISYIKCFLFYKTNNFTQDIKIKIKHVTWTYAFKSLGFNQIKTY